jgi:hypothetical protein
MKEPNALDVAQARDAKRRAASKHHKAALADHERAQVEVLRGEQARLKAEAAGRRARHA